MPYTWANQTPKTRKLSKEMLVLAGVNSQTSPWLQGLLRAGPACILSPAPSPYPSPVASKALTHFTRDLPFLKWTTLVTTPRFSCYFFCLKCPSKYLIKPLSQLSSWITSMSSIFWFIQKNSPSQPLFLLQMSILEPVRIYHFQKTDHAY